MLTAWVVDTSALSRMIRSGDQTTWRGRIDRGLVSMCTVTRLEIGFSAGSVADWDKITSTYPMNKLIHVLTTPDMEARAIEVQRLLATRGQHRAASAVDLITAATAESIRSVVLHVDKDFELIAGVTGQAVERLAAGGAGDRVGGW